MLQSIPGVTHPRWGARQRKKEEEPSSRGAEPPLATLAPSRWDGSPGNTFYQVQRKLLGEALPTIIGGSGNKSFTDETLPFGTDSVQYIVTAIRGNVSGNASSSLNVQFGVGGDGFSVAKVKLAA